MDTIQILIRADKPDVNSSSSAEGAKFVGGGDEDDYELECEMTERPVWWRSKCKLVLNLVLISASAMLVQMAFMMHARPGQMLNFYEPGQIVEATNAAVSVKVNAPPNTTATLVSQSSSGDIGDNGFSWDFYKSTDWILLLTNMFCKLLDCWLIPLVLIDKLGAKLTIVISASSYLVYFLLLLIKPLKSALYIGVFANELFGNSFLVASLVYAADIESRFVRLMGYKVFAAHPFYLAVFNSSFVWISCLRILLVRVKGADVIFGDDVHIALLTMICVCAGIVFAACSRYSGLKEAVKGKEETKKMKSYDINYSTSGADSNSKKSIWLVTPLILFLGMLQAFGFKLFTTISLSSSEAVERAVLVYGLTACVGNLFTGIVWGHLISERLMMFISMLACYSSLCLLYFAKLELIANLNLLIMIPAFIGGSSSLLEAALIAFHNQRTSSSSSNASSTFCRLVFIKAAGILLATFVYVSTQMAILVLLGLLSLGLASFCLFSLLESC